MREEQENPVGRKLFMIKTIPDSKIKGKKDIIDSSRAIKDINDLLENRAFVSSEQSSVVFHTAVHGKEFICTLVMIRYEEQVKLQKNPVKCKLFMIKSSPALEIIGDDTIDSNKALKDIHGFLENRIFVDDGQSSVVFQTTVDNKEVADFICTLIMIYYKDREV